MKTEKQIKLARAKEHVAELKKFYTNLSSYIFAILGLAALNYYQNGWNHPWFLWAAFGWGIGIIFHALKAFNKNPFLSKDWEERKIKEFMEEEKQNSLEQWE